MSSSARDLLLPLSILASVAVGVAIGGWIVRPAVPFPASTLSAGSGSDELIVAMESLRVEIVRMRERIETMPEATGSSARVDAISGSALVAGDVQVELRKVTDQLAQTAEALRSAAARTGGDRAPLTPPSSVDPAPLEALIRAQPDENKDAHQLWTYQQVMDRFGRPDRIGREDGGMYWIYTGKSGSAIFHFADGRVLYVRPTRR